MKKFVTFVTVLALTLGSAFTVFAENGAEAPALTVTTRAFIGGEGQVLGTVPSIAGMGDLNARIESTIVSQFDTFTGIFGDSYVETDAFLVSHSVENQGNYTQFTLTIRRAVGGAGSGTTDIVFNFYINRATNTEMTAEAFAAAVAALAEAGEEVAEEVPVVDDEDEDEDEEVVVEPTPVMVGLRANAELFGYDLAWDDATRTVTLYFDDELFASVTVGLDNFVVEGEAFILGAAPVNVDGSVMVPAAFFVRAGLALSYEVNAYGTVTFQLATAEETANGEEVDEEDAE